MQIYWTQKSIPELGGLGASQRRAAWRACFFQSFKHWQTWIAFVGQFAILLMGGFIGLFIDGQTWILFGGFPPEIEKMRFPVATLTLVLVAAFLGSLVFAQVFCYMMRPYLKNY